MFEVLADSAPAVSSDAGWLAYLVAAAGTGLIGFGGAVLKLGHSAGKFLGPLITRLAESHVNFLQKMETTIEQQVEVGKQQAEATRTVGECVTAMRNEHNDKLRLIHDIHDKVCK